MSDRIRELIEQHKPKKEFWMKQLIPGVIFNAAWDKGVAPEDISEEFLEEHFPYIPALVGYSEIEKFAEAIIKECAELAEQNYEPHEYILKHFGIE